MLQCALIQADAAAAFKVRARATSSDDVSLLNLSTPAVIISRVIHVFSLELKVEI